MPRAGGARTGTIIPQPEVGTDRHRMDMWTKASAAAYNAFGEGRGWKFSKFRSTNGYVADAARRPVAAGPFLHNGSVPSLADLLEPVEARPRTFWRGYDVYDPARVGFVTTGPEAQREGTLPRYQPTGQQQCRPLLRHGHCLPPPSARCWNT